MQIFICRSSLEVYKQDIMPSNHHPQTNKQKNHSTMPPAQDREATVLISFTKVLPWFAD